MSLAYKINGKNRLFVKGASEMIMRSCSKFQNFKTGQIVNMDENLKN